MARLREIGAAVNATEEWAMAYLRDNLPADYVVIANFELRQGREIFEIDLAILAPHCVYLVDVKGVHGRVTVQGGRWHPAGRDSYPSPAAKIRRNAKILSTLIKKRASDQSKTPKIYVQSVVLLTANDVELIDKNQQDSPDVVYRYDCLNFFLDQGCVPFYCLQNIRAYYDLLEDIIADEDSSTNDILERRLIPSSAQTNYPAQPYYFKEVDPKILKRQRRFWVLCAMAVLFFCFFCQCQNYAIDSVKSGMQNLVSYTTP